jgi:hypothetical protein
MGFKRATSGIGAVEYPFMHLVCDWPRPNIPTQNRNNHDNVLVYTKITKNLPVLVCQKDKRFSVHE